MNPVTISREQLYELVWTTPLLRLAVQFGVSNVALGKLCRRLNVPLPGRGYWARIAAGEKLKRPLLPKPTGNQGAVRIAMDPTPAPIQNGPRVEPPEVPVGDSLEGAHDVVRQVAVMMRKAPINEHDCFVVGNHMLVVTAAAHRRALLILDGLCRALVERGHSIAVQGSAEQMDLHVVVKGEQVSFGMAECLERVEHVLTVEEQKSVEDGGGKGVRKYDYAPRGRLKIVVRGVSWADTAKRRLERALGHIVLAIEAGAAEQKGHREDEVRRKLEEEQRQQRETEERARARRRERLEEYGRLLATDLERMATAWSRAQQVREFLDAYEGRVPKDTRSDSAQQWLEASRRYAERLDPLANSAAVARELRPSDEMLDDAMAQLKKAVDVGGRP